MLNGERHWLKPDDVLYNYENEPHTFINENNIDFAFVEFLFLAHVKLFGHRVLMFAYG